MCLYEKKVGQIGLLRESKLSKNINYWNEKNSEHQKINYSVSTIKWLYFVRIATNHIFIVLYWSD